MSGTSQRPAPAPMRLRPILKHRVWGGRSLERFGHALPDEANYGEAWVVADLPDAGPAAATSGESSVVESGPWCGQPLRAVLKADPRALLGQARAGEHGGFPLLIKLLDARENLSVQVHPTRSYADRHPGAHVKDETWFVLHAEPGALIYRGLRRPLDAAEFRRRIHDGGIVEDLSALPVRAGDVVDLPSGTCHALGAGIVVAEVQTPSDTTFRLFDWGRKGRELHIDQAIEVMFGPDGADHLAVEHPAVVQQHRPTSPSAPTIESDGLRTTFLCRTPAYDVQRLEVSADHRGPVTLPLITDDQPVVLLPLAGHGRLVGGNAVEPLHRGHATLLPAGLRGWLADLSPGSTLLRVEVPGPTRLV